MNGKKPVARLFFLAAFAFGILAAAAETGSDHARQGSSPLPRSLAPTNDQRINQGVLDNYISEGNIEGGKRLLALHPDTLSPTVALNKMAGYLQDQDVEKAVSLIEIYPAMTKPFSTPVPKGNDPTTSKGTLYVNPIDILFEVPAMRCKPGLLRLIDTFLKNGADVNQTHLFVADKDSNGKPVSSGDIVKGEEQPNYDNFTYPLIELVRTQIKCRPRPGSEDLSLNVTLQGLISLSKKHGQDLDLDAVDGVKEASNSALNYVLDLESPTINPSGAKDPAVNGDEAAYRLAALKDLLEAGANPKMVNHGSYQTIALNRWAEAMGAYNHTVSQINNAPILAAAGSPLKDSEMDSLINSQKGQGLLTAFYQSANEQLTGAIKAWNQRQQQQR